jgi:hypothetical protein
MRREVRDPGKPRHKSKCEPNALPQESADTVVLVQADVLRDDRSGHGGDANGQANDDPKKVSRSHRSAHRSAVVPKQQSAIDEQRQREQARADHQRQSDTKNFGNRRVHAGSVVDSARAAQASFICPPFFRGFESLRLPLVDPFGNCDYTRRRSFASRICPRRHGLLTCLK